MKSNGTNAKGQPCGVTWGVSEATGLAVIVARKRFTGPDFDRLARAEWLVQDAISYRIEHARRGLYQSL